MGKSKRLILLLLIIYSYINSQGQDLVCESNKLLFHAIQHSDVKKLSEQLLSTQAIREIMKLGILEEEDSIEWIANQSGVVQDSVIALSIMDQLKAEADSMAINLIDAEFVDCYYSTSKQPGSLIPSMKGTIQFKHANQYYVLGIEESVYWKQQWKVLAISGIERLEDSVSNAIRRITDYGFFDRNIKIESIQLIGDNPLPPPPPPPVRSIPSKKMKRKN